MSNVHARRVVGESGDLVINLEAFIQEMYGVSINAFEGNDTLATLIESALDEMRSNARGELIIPPTTTEDEVRFKVYKNKVTHLVEVQCISRSTRPPVDDEERPYLGGTWKVGDVVIGAPGGSQMVPGWVCVTEGIPGTWKQFGEVPLEELLEQVTDLQEYVRNHSVWEVNSDGDLSPILASGQSRNVVPQTHAEIDLGKKGNVWRTIYVDRWDSLIRSFSYAVGDIVFSRALPSNKFLQCMVAGVTGSTELDLTNVASNQVITDGTVTWRVQSLASQEMLMNKVLSRGTSYVVGDVVGDVTLPSKYFLRCVTAGTTGSINLDLRSVVEWELVIDGSATFMVVSITSPEDEEIMGVGYHNSHFRGRNLGNSVTAEQWAQIDAGTFRGLFVGDYWEKNSNKWRIADYDYWYNVGDTAFTKHHLVIVPDKVLYSTKYNNSNTTEGGYMGSELFAGLNQAITACEAVFGAAHIPTHRVLLPTTCTGGKYTGWGWQDRRVDLMTEVMVYGARAWGDSGNNGYVVASQHSQLSMFRYDRNLINTRETYWLQDVTSSTHFAAVSGGGNAGGSGASDSLGVRPAFPIVG